MYRKSPQGWLKHWDFILLDILSSSGRLYYCVFHSEWDSGTHTRTFLYRSEACCFCPLSDSLLLFWSAVSGNSEAWSVLLN